MDRRTVLLGGVALTAIGAFAALRMGPASARTAEGPFEITLTEDEWKAKLPPDVYNVLREEFTERPYSSPLNEEKRDGIFACAGCDLPLFDSKTKYDSRTGWPSFYQPLDGAIGEATDFKLGYARTEVHCSRCGGHQGHLFDDGPQPTGLRYCINGLAMVFQPASAG